MITVLIREVVKKMDIIKQVIMINHHRQRTIIEALLQLLKILQAI